MSRRYYQDEDDYHSRNRKRSFDYDHRERNDDRKRVRSHTIPDDILRQAWAASPTPYSFEDMLYNSEEERKKKQWADNGSSSSSDSQDDEKRRRKKKHKRKSKKQKKDHKRKRSDLSPDRYSSHVDKKPRVSERGEQGEDEDSDYGPVSHNQLDVGVSYGGNLLSGEGAAMAQFIQQNKRIPRRGEIGLRSDEIEHFEKVGYVMSGNRHKLMNAVRMRKENQVYTAEERKTLTLLHHEEKVKRDNKILAQFRELINKNGD